VLESKVRSLKVKMMRPRLSFGQVRNPPPILRDLYRLRYLRPGPFSGGHNRRPNMLGPFLMAPRTIHPEADRRILRLEGCRLSCGR
jgi:hypothetical protein